MVRVENAASLLLIELQSPRERGIADPRIAYREIHDCLERHRRWDAHGAFVSPDSGGRRNIPLVVAACGNGFLQRIRGFPECICDSLPLRDDHRQVKAPDDVPALPLLGSQLQTWRRT
jgi:hypothetical protein